jgi:PEP-CTERM motif
LTIVLWSVALAPRTASAAIIGLSTPVTGTNTAGDVIGLTVSFDPNGSAAANVVSMDLYVAFTGLTPLGYVLGDIFTPYASDPSFFALNGVCADLFTCMYPEGVFDSPSTYQAFASVPTPHAPAGPGTLFTLQFAVSPGSSAWSLNVLGDDGFGLLWDPTPEEVCDFEDPNCDPGVPPIPFALVLPEGSVPDGLARVSVGVTAPPGQEEPPPGPTPVPEPASLMLLGAGLLAVAARHRRRRP